MVMAEPATKSIFEPDDEEHARLDAEAMNAYREGRYVSHAEMAKWLNSWGTPGSLPLPRPKQ